EDANITLRKNANDIGYQLALVEKGFIEEGLAVARESLALADNRFATLQEQRSVNALQKSLNARSADNAALSGALADPDMSAALASVGGQEYINSLRERALVKDAALADDALANAIVDEHLADLRMQLTKAEEIANSKEAQALRERLTAVKAAVANNRAPELYALALDSSAAKVDARSNRTGAQLASEASTKAAAQLSDAETAVASLELQLSNVQYIEFLKRRSLLEQRLDVIKSAAVMADEEFAVIQEQRAANDLQRSLNANAAKNAALRSALDDPNQSASLGAVGADRRVLAMRKEVLERGIAEGSSEYKTAMMAKYVLDLEKRLQRLRDQNKGTLAKELESEIAWLQTEMKAGNAPALYERGLYLDDSKLAAMENASPEQKAQAARNRQRQQLLTLEESVAAQELHLAESKFTELKKSQELLAKRARAALMSSTYRSEEMEEVEEEIALLQARAKLRSDGVRAAALQAAIDEDPEGYIAGKAEDKVGKRRLGAAVAEQVNLSLEDGELIAREQAASLRNKNITRESKLNNKDIELLSVEALVLQAKEREQEKRIKKIAEERLMAEGVARPDKGYWGGETHGRVGGLKGALQNPGEFFGGGLLSTMKYGVGAGIMYGSWGLIKDAVKDSEDLAISFTKLEAQLADIGHLDAFEGLKKSIVDTSRATGVAADEVAATALRMEGAFGRTTAANALRGGGGGDLYGADLVKEQSEAAAKLMMVTNLTQKE
ncbi:MAG: hypothetical protein KDA17_02905, partial [Candidatus Saccharibacteria bacterium]|nr:hypothetical protein [Candidatus Saccharibacteria bacterium]